MYKHLIIFLFNFIIVPVFAMEMDTDESKINSALYALDAFHADCIRYQLVEQLGVHCTAQFEAIKKRVYLQHQIEHLSGEKWEAVIREYASRIDSNSFLISTIEEAFGKEINLKDFIDNPVLMIDHQTFITTKEEQLLFLASRWFKKQEIITQEQKEIEILVAILYPKMKVEATPIIISEHGWSVQTDIGDAAKTLYGKNKKKTNKDNGES